MLIKALCLTSTYKWAGFQLYKTGILSINAPKSYALHEMAIFCRLESWVKIHFLSLEGKFSRFSPRFQQGEKCLSGSHARTYNLGVVECRSLLNREPERFPYPPCYVVVKIEEIPVRDFPIFYHVDWLRFLAPKAKKSQSIEQPLPSSPVYWRQWKDCSTTEMAMNGHFYRYRFWASKAQNLVPALLSTTNHNINKLCARLKVAG